MASFGKQLITIYKEKVAHIAMEIKNIHLKHLLKKQNKYMEINMIIHKHQ